MSFTITQAFVQQYKNNVIHLSQQKGSRLRMCVRTQPNVVGLNYYFERIGATSVMIKQSRHSPTPLISTPHSRRRVSMVTYQWGDLVDNDDRLKLLINPESEYVIAGRNAFGRVMDDIIIAAALGTAFAGSDGATAVQLPTSGGPINTGQYVPDTPIANDLNVQSTADDGGGMSPQRVRQAKFLFDAQDVDPDEERYIIASAAAIKNMLRFVEVTSADYNTVKALAEGAIDTYMGFKWIMSNRLPLVGQPSPLEMVFQPITGIMANNDRMCIAFARQGLGLAMQEDVLAEIAKRPDMSFATQVYMEMVMGATRVEEPKVVVMPVVEV